MAEAISLLIRARCQQQGWYGPDAFKGRRSGEPGKSLFQNGFAFPPATEAQLQRTESLLGFSLPPLLHILYSDLANGGFGPGSGLRGAVEGYGTRGTPLPNKYRWLADETLIKYHLSESLVDLAQFTDQWQRRGKHLVLQLPCNVWPRQLFPICDLGDDVEVCLDGEGNLYHSASSSENGIYMLTERGVTFETWLSEWLEKQ